MRRSIAAKLAVFSRRHKLWTFNVIGPRNLAVGGHIWNINKSVKGRHFVWNKVSCFCLGISFLFSLSPIAYSAFFSWSSYSSRLRSSTVSLREWRWFKASTSARSSAMRAASLALAVDIELVLESLLDLDPHSVGLGLFRWPIPTWEALSSGVTRLSWRFISVKIQDCNKPTTLPTKLLKKLCGTELIEYANKHNAYKKTVKQRKLITQNYSQITKLKTRILVPTLSLLISHLRCYAVTFLITLFSFRNSCCQNKLCFMTNNGRNILDLTKLGTHSLLG